MADYKNNRADRSSRRPAPASRGPAPQVDPRTGRTGFARPNVAATNASAGNRADRSSTRARPQFAVGNIPPGQQNTPGWRPPSSTPSTWQQRVDARNSGTRPGAPGGPAEPPAGGLGGIPASVNPPGWNGPAYQAALERGGTVNGGERSVSAPVPSRPTPGAGAPPPAPAVQSGFSQQRIDPSTGTQIAGQAAFGAGSSLLGSPQIDWNSLQKSINGEGWTNAGVVAGTQTDMNGSVKNPFVESQLTPAQPLTPGTPGFAPGMPTLGGALAGAGNVPMSASSPTPGLVQASYTPGLELTGGEAPAVAPEAVAPEEAAQEFALGALQDQIRRNRLDLR